ncbi:MAG: NAD(P)-dependent alcohol dehydrogenase [Cyclobacteriaceae bacterium]|nr:NAD(P)-dependent alcohol dehydrogenase [Cyclobacteriaceae bacterium]
MKAAVYTQYGGPERLSLLEMPTPVPSEHEVLIKVQATSINSWDYDLLIGAFMARLIGGVRKPKQTIIGCDVAGTVESVGSEVTRWKKGDRVFGDLSGGKWGGFAEYALGDENVLARIPEKLSHEQASAIPQAGLLALQGLRKGGLDRGMNALINGAGGGVGMFAIQLAKAVGAEVTAVDKSSKFERMKLWGANHLIDFKIHDYTRQNKQYDLILDNIAARSVSDYRRALASKGKFIMTGGTPGTILRVATWGQLSSILTAKKVTMVGLKYSPDDLSEMANLAVTGDINVAIDKVFPLDQIQEAFRYFGNGEYRGKVIIAPQ